MTPEQEKIALDAMQDACKAIVSMQALMEELCTSHKEFTEIVKETRAMMAENLEIAHQYKQVLGDPLERGQLTMSILKSVIGWLIGMFGGVWLIREAWIGWIRPWLGK